MQKEIWQKIGDDLSPSEKYRKLGRVDKALGYEAYGSHLHKKGDESKLIQEWEPLMPITTNMKVKVGDIVKVVSKSHLIMNNDLFKDANKDIKEGLESFESKIRFKMAGKLIVEVMPEGFEKELEKDGWVFAPYTYK